MDRRSYLELIKTAKIGDALPNGFVFRRFSLGFLQRETSGSTRNKVVTEAGMPGISCRIGPVNFEIYVGDTEPIVKPGGPLRRILWQPITRTDRPTGWGRSWLDSRIRMTGFAEIVAGEPYDKKWTDHAKRHAKRWRKERGVVWEMVTPTLEEFIAAYKKAKKDPTLKFLFVAQLRTAVRAHGSLVRLFGVRRAGTNGPIEAGFACIDVPEAASSLHLISFINESLRKTPVGVGLMDEWFVTSPALGIRFLDFGVFWAKGDPMSWQGFSQFKAQFGIHFICYPIELARWEGWWWQKK